MFIISPVTNNQSPRSFGRASHRSRGDAAAAWLPASGSPRTARVARLIVCVVLATGGTWIASFGGGRSNRLAAAEDGFKASRAAIFRTMNRLDTDRNKTLDWEEFRGLGGDPKELQRDFELYDFSGDGTLSSRELGAVHGVVSPSYRNSIPDPWDDILRDAVAAMDESYDHWNHRPTDTVNSRMFVQNFLRSVTERPSAAVTGNLMLQVDRTMKGFLHRKDVRLFLEKQLGIRSVGGQLLRETTGRTKCHARWIQFDSDKNEAISREEFERHWWDKDTVKDDFDAVDADKNGELRIQEFLHRDSPHHNDPIEWFRSADTDYDAMIDQAELVAASPSHKERLLSSTIPAFDQNGDAKLSLQEYRLSMHACSNLFWGKLRRDVNRDGLLTFHEFSANQGTECLLQHRFFFHRLDRNQDRRLSPAEFDFDFNPNRKWTIEIFDVVADKLIATFTPVDRPGCGSPAFVAGDDSFVVDTFPLRKRDSAKLALVSATSGRRLLRLGGGRMGAISPDRTTLAYDTPGPDGPEVKLVVLPEGFTDKDSTDHGPVQAIAAADEGDTDRNARSLGPGRGPEWSPDGRHLAFVDADQLWIYDLEAAERRPVRTERNLGASFLHGNIAWDPTGKHVVFKAQFDGRVSIILCKNVVDAPDLLVIYAADHTRLGSDFSFTPDGRQIVTNMKADGDDRPHVYAFASSGEEPPERFGKRNGDYGWDFVKFSTDMKLALGLKKN